MNGGFNVALGSATLTTGNDNSSTAYSGVISGSGGLTKAGSGTFTLSGANTYTGATGVNGGVLAFSSTSAMQGTSGVTVANAATLRYTGGSTNFGKNITVTGGTGTLENTGGGTLTLAGTLTKDATTLKFNGGTFNVTGVIAGPSAGSDVIVANASNVTYSNANTYVGPTSVIENSTLALGANNGIPTNSTLTLGNATTQGIFNMGGFTDSIAQLVFSGSGGKLMMAANQTSGAQLTTLSTLTLGSNSVLDLTGMSTGAGLYRLISYTSASGQFASVMGLASGYQLVYGATGIDIQRASELGTITVTNPASPIITGGSAAFTYTVANNSPSGGSALVFSGTGVTNVAGTSSGSAPAGGTSSPVSGLSFNGTSVGAGQTGTFNVNAPGAYGTTTATGTVSVDVYNHAQNTLSTGTIGLGNVHVGYSTPVTGTIGAGNAAGYRVAMSGTATPSSSGNVSLSTLSGSSAVAAGSTGTITASLATGKTAGAVNQNFTYTFGDASSLSGASANVGTAAITVTGTVYSGQATWATDGGGSWGTLNGTGANAFGANWGAYQGSPGLDANFASTDTATFAAAATSGLATVTLDGANPSLKGITFDNAAASYAIAAGSGGALVLNGGSSAATIDVLAGDHAISTGITLGTNAAISVAADSLLRLSGVISGNTFGLTMSGAGELRLSGHNTYGGGTTIDSGLVKISAIDAFGTGDVILNGGTLDLGLFDISNVVKTYGGTVINSKPNSTTEKEVYGDTTFTGGGDTGGSITVNSGGTATFDNGVTASVAVAAGASATFNDVVMSAADVQVASSGTATFKSNVNQAAMTNNGTVVLNTTTNSPATVSTNFSGSGTMQKQGDGSVTLSGDSTFSSVQVQGGNLEVAGSVTSDVWLAANTSLSGSGQVGGTISGSGSINPGNSPGITTVESVDPTGGLSFNFEFTAANTYPTWSNAADSINDVLHLTSGTPFTSSLTSANIVNIYFDTSVTNGGTFYGGFFASSNILSSIRNGTFNYFELGAVPGQPVYTYNGVDYHRLDSSIVAVGTTQVASANFAGGTVTDGFTTSFVVVPEPSTAVLALIGVGSAAIFLRRRRRPA